MWYWAKPPTFLLLSNEPNPTSLLSNWELIAMSLREDKKKEWKFRWLQIRNFNWRNQTIYHSCVWSTDDCQATGIPNLYLSREPVISISSFFVTPGAQLLPYASSHLSVPVPWSGPHRIEIVEILILEKYTQLTSTQYPEFIPLELLNEGNKSCLQLKTIGLNYEALGKIFLL